ncbi:MAG: peptidoglycan-binding domain-containing protein [Pseudomonadota bacterium]
MRLTKWIDELPIEEWAAGLGRLTRRARRRVARRRSAALGGALAVVLAVAVGSNALWQQDADHPAPLLAGHGDRDTPVRSVSLDTPVPDASPQRTSTLSSPMVERVQNALGSTGHYQGPVTGVLTEETVVAIRIFQAENGLEVTGEPGLALLAALPPEGAVRTVGAAARPSPATPATAQPATVNLDVAEIQRLLNARGFGPLEVDGKMGPMTRSAIGRFSVARGLSGSGITPEFMRALAEGGA